MTDDLAHRAPGIPIRVLAEHAAYAHLVGSTETAPELVATVPTYRGLGHP